MAVVGQVYGQQWAISFAKLPLIVPTFFRNKRRNSLQLRRGLLPRLKLLRLQRQKKEIADPTNSLYRTQRDPIEPGSTDLFSILDKWHALALIPSRFILGLGIRVVLDLFFRVVRARKPIVEYPQDFFSGDTGLGEFSYLPFPGTGWEVNVPYEKAGEAVDIVLSVLDRIPIAAPVAVRYVKATAGTLTQTRYAPYTATIEMSSVYARLAFHNTHEAFDEIEKALEARRDEIPHCYHWGQKFPENGFWVERAFG